MTAAIATIAAIVGAGSFAVLVLRKVDRLMASVEELLAAAAQDRARTDSLISAVSGLAEAIAILAGQVGTIPAAAQAAIDAAVATLAGTDVDTAAVEQQLADLVASITPAPPEPVPGE